MGEDITVTFELSSREYMERWYTSADARNIMKGMPQQQGFGMPQQGYSMPQQQQSYGAPQQGFGTPQQGNAQMPGTNAPFGPQQGGGDDLPF
ncbi:Uncharacterised protein [Chlamydia trachomatis]|nr:Uncharacterised protein [Chlamydia trachomatis]